MPVTATPMPSSVPATPTSVVQKGNVAGASADFVPLLVELLRDAKAIFKDNPAEALTKATGGEEFSFVRQNGLEDAIQKIGSQLHSEYIVTYRPNNMEEGGFHEIKVRVKPNNAGWKVHARPGYWMAAVFNNN